MTQSNQSEIILYTTPDGTIKIETIFQDETIWLTQKKMAALFGVKRPAITKHLKNIFESGELDKKVVGSILEHTTQHGAMAGKTQTKPVKRIAEEHYEEFDNKRKRVEAHKADEEIEKKLLENRGKSNE